MTDSSECGSPYITDCCCICDPKKKYFNCICGKNWDTFEEHLCNLKSDNELVKQQLEISTMTLCCNFNSHLDLDTLADLYTESVKYAPNAKKTTKTKKSSKNDCFYNSLLMTVSTKYQSPNRVSVKFFPNGKLQIAGCKTIRSCCYVIRKSFERLRKNDCFIDSEPMISDCKIVMINSDLKLNNYINQQEMTEVLSKQTTDKNFNFIQVVYQSWKYPGINAKFIPDNRLMEYSSHVLSNNKSKIKGVISLLIFRPGSIIITGGNNLADYIAARDTLLNIIEKNKHVIYVD